ncbi:MAG: hypothetical protein LKE46_13575 [Clostridium sp.]|uniref:hypothetical protein n=1 Tax=Clostridium sp. TaxID=1506 RepID=UPI0025C42DF3|nr:hypothetical protein [Clostridium sp.]MCH3965284.1 hypothetical protein [Clostridium sp.]MCI1714505.1 hypothetical protein [Clostridium sp.]MCI1798767.1 hypothetical protein [Clostridium sp.]MCI1812502.1 hypothetical protein [Clostridium sp.]MCI1869577.1 hypothetical protein [Clostridium sp.]
MSRKNIFSIVLCIICILSLSFRSLAYKVDTQEKGVSRKIFFKNGEKFLNNKSDVFREILTAVHGRTVEYGIMAQFDSLEPGEKAVNELFYKLNKIARLNKTYSRNGENYLIEFYGNSINGYIESTPYDDHNIIKMDIIKRDKEYRLDELKNDISSILENSSEKIRYFEYIKAKLENNNINSCYRETVETLKNIGDNDIKTGVLENGYTATTYTGQYDSIYTNGKPVDFNFAIVGYTTGSYIIMGTPEIMETY